MRRMRIKVALAGSGERVVQYRERVWGGRAVRRVRERERAYDQGQQPESQSEPSPVLSLGFHVHHLPDVDCKMLAEVTLLVRQGPISECRQDIFSGSYLFGARQDGR